MAGRRSPGGSERGTSCRGQACRVESSCRSPNTACLLWWPDKRPLPGEGDAQPEPDTGSSLSDTKQTAELWHFDPPHQQHHHHHTHRKTISTVIKGELNRLIFSKVTEPPPPPPLPLHLFLLPSFLPSSSPPPPCRHQ